MGSKAEREWWVKVNIDDLCHDLDRLESTEERGQWLEGFRVGSRGHEPRDTWGQPKMLGHTFGMKCHDEAVIFRDKKVIAGQISADNRREKNGTAQPLKMIPAEHAPNGVRTVFDVCSEHTPEQTAEHASNQPTTNSYQPTTSNQKRTTSNESPLYPPKGKRFVPPTEPEWVAYCVETWPDWHRECAADSWAYYESKGWRIGSAPCKDWKATARTAHGNARSWGKLQPVAGSTRAANSPGSPPSTRQMTPEEQNRLRGHRLDLERAERDLRIARNRPHDYDVDEAARKVDEVRARILKMGADPDEKGKVA